MAEEPKQRGSGGGLAKTPVYPDADMPASFYDGVSNFHFSKEVIKFYFFRLDPATNAVGPSHPLVVEQIIMPITGFAQTVAFFQKAVEGMIAAGRISQEDWSTAQKMQNEVNFDA